MSSQETRPELGSEAEILGRLVGGAFSQKTRPTLSPRQRKLARDRYLFARYCEGATTKELCEEFGIKAQSVYRVIEKQKKRNHEELERQASAAVIRMFETVMRTAVRRHAEGSLDEGKLVLEGMAKLGYGMKPSSSMMVTMLQNNPNGVQQVLGIQETETYYDAEGRAHRGTDSLSEAITAHAPRLAPPREVQGDSLRPEVGEDEDVPTDGPTGTWSDLRTQPGRVLEAESESAVDVSYAQANQEVDLA